MSRYVGEGGFCAPFFFFGGNYEISREVGGKLAPFESIRFFEEVVTMLNRGYELHLI